MNVQKRSHYLVGVELYKNIGQVLSLFNVVSVERVNSFRDIGHDHVKVLLIGLYKILMIKKTHVFF